MVSFADAAPDLGDKKFLNVVSHTMEEPRSSQFQVVESKDSYEFYIHHCSRRM